MQWHSRGGGQRALQFSTALVTRAGRRSSKIVSLLVSCFSASYVRLWPQHFGAVPLAATPMFDGRAVCYPDTRTLRDYLTWRQVDTHINNQVRARRPCRRCARQGGMVRGCFSAHLRARAPAAVRSTTHASGRW